MNVETGSGRVPAIGDRHAAHAANRAPVESLRPESDDDRHLCHRATAVVFGHPHIPRTDRRDGVRFEEVSLGHPRERHLHHGDGRVLSQTLPAQAAAR